jgi:palmitoyltransferase
MTDLIFLDFQREMVNRKVKLLIPKDRGELIPIFFVLFLICVYVIFELCVILPTIYNNIFTYKEILHLIFGLYVIFNLIGNLFLCMATDTSIDTIICPVLLPPADIPTNSQQEMISQHCNWHYCYRCEVNVPPRSQHCHLCRKCILKRDHHCSFLGRCIGFRNIRYYICFLIWSSVNRFI